MIILVLVCISTIVILLAISLVRSDKNKLKIPLYETRVAGISYNARDQTIERIVEDIHPDTNAKYRDFGDLLATIDLNLKLEPDNPSDPNAIGVWYSKNGINYHLGYIPKNETSAVYDLLSLNLITVGRIYSSSHHHKRCHLLKDHETKHYIKLSIHRI